MIDTNAAQAVNGSSGDADVDAISSPDPRANGNGADSGINFDAMAKELGYVEKDKFRGKEEDWLPPEQYIQKALREAKLTRARVQFQDRHIQDITGKLSSLEERTKKQDQLFEEMVGRLRAQDDRGFRHHVQNLEAEMDAAAEEGDKERYQKVKRQLLELGRAAQPAQEKKPNEPKPNGADNSDKKPSPEVAAWMAENPWFNPNDDDDDASIYAIRQDAKISRKHPHLSPRERLDKVKEAVERRFPEQFENANRRQPAPVNAPSGGGNRGGGGKRSKTVADLDADQKAALAMIKRRDPKFKDEDYLKNLK